MDLSTTYMGIKLPHPLIPGASPMVDNLETVKRLEDAGAPLIVMHSLFEEQIVNEELYFTYAIEHGDFSTPEALSYFPHPAEFALGTEEYLEQIARIKLIVSVPVIASLNGTTEGGWLAYASLIEQAGADGLELNIYDLAANPAETGEQVETRALQVIRAVRDSITIPIAVKLSPFYSSIANFAQRVDELGVEGLILFNRFYQPDIDIENLEAVRVNLSSPADLLLRLRWLALLHGKLRASLACTGGVHSATDAIKAVMAGADAVQMVSCLLQRGPAYLKEVREGMIRWLEEHEYETLAQMHGNMSVPRCADPKAYERANYMRLLQSW
jgi:dihydroorotate dehydrogenase (fumarate)